MTVTRMPDGRWQVSDRSGQLAGPFATSAEAWRWIDRNTGTAVSRSEATGQWVWDRSVDRSFGQ